MATSTAPSTDHSNMNNNNPRKLRILMLHGFTQTGHTFELKTKALKKSLDKAFPSAPSPGHLQNYPGGLSLHYPTGPIKLSPASVPGYSGDDTDEIEAYGWWKRKEGSRPGEPFYYEGIEAGLGRIAEVIREEGPFDGVMGFSQGGCASGMVASLLEPSRRAAFDNLKEGMEFPASFSDDNGEPIQPPMKFAVSYSGFAASDSPLYRAFYEPKIETPMLHYLGSVDTIVSEERSLRLVEACKDGRGKEGGVARLVYHPGGHVVPSTQKQYIAALVAFIREAVGEGSAANGKNGEAQGEKVEDMDVPF